MLSFVLDLPRSIRFGAGARTALGESIGDPRARVLLVCGSRWLRASRWAAEIEESLGPRKLQWVSCPSGEPTVRGVDSILETARAFAPDVVVGIGGGSVMDTAKAVAGLTGEQGSAADYLEGIGAGRSIDRPGVPFVAVPTTAGTGAEATRNAVIKSPEHGVKKSLRSRHLLARDVLVDPELALELPPAITGSSGMDALVQLVESYLSRKAQPVPQALAADALAGHLQGLERLIDEPADIEARSMVAYGALLSGIALANSGLGAAHGFASILGGVTDLPHGLICAVMIGPVLRANAPAIREPLGRMLRRAYAARGQEVPRGAEEDPVGWLVQRIEGLLDGFGLPRRIPRRSVEGADIPAVAARSSGSSMSGNPVELDQARREAILAEALE